MDGRASKDQKKIARFNLTRISIRFIPFRGGLLGMRRKVPKNTQLMKRYIDSSKYWAKLFH
jgi:hypothetical protein